MIKNQEIKIFSSLDDLFDAAANDFMRRAIAAVNNKGVFSVVLSGGNTPKQFFESLTRIDFDTKTIPWQKIQFFFGDERYVSLDKKESNYHTAAKFLFSKVPVNPANIYRIPTDFSDPKDAAKQYEKTLREVFKIKDKAIPKFDLAYLGLGDNGHTASLMPFSEIVTRYSNKALIENDNQLVASLWVQELDMYRISLTPTVLNNSMNIFFLVTGANKEITVREVLEGPYDPIRYPAQLIQCVDGKTIWYLDRLAAEKLNFINSSK
jgi:6-phosphogluconolactonase